MSNFIVTNPANPTQTYVFGTRGRAPRFVTEGLANGTIKVPEGYVSTKDKLAAVVPRAVKTTTRKTEKLLEKLGKNLLMAKNKEIVAQRHLDEARKVREGLEAEIEAVKAAPVEVEAEQEAEEVTLAVTTVEPASEPATV